MFNPDVLKVPLFKKNTKVACHELFISFLSSIQVNSTHLFCPLLAISSSFLLAKSFPYMVGHSSEKLKPCYNL